jgi:hypothetical protein
VFCTTHARSGEFDHRTPGAAVELESVLSALVAGGAAGGRLRCVTDLEGD